MKFSLAAPVFAAAVQAQSLAGMPSCAMPCLTASVKKMTSCEPTDVNCLCAPKNMELIRSDATSCVIKECGAKTGKMASLQMS